MKYFDDKVFDAFKPGETQFVHLKLIPCNSVVNSVKLRG